MSRTLRMVQFRRGAFTLVELLVVITIIGILMSLLIPAVQAARETARRSQCASQMNNLAKAALQYEMSHKGFPGWVNDFGRFIGNSVPDPSDPEGPNLAKDHKKLGGWAIKLFPLLEAQPTYEIWTQDKYPVIVHDPLFTSYFFSVNSAPNLAILQCPSSPSITGKAGRMSYVANVGMFVGVGGSGGVVRPRANTLACDTDDAEVIGFERGMKKENGVFKHKYAKNTSAIPEGPDVRLDDMKDGPGSTVLFSENLQAVPWHFLYPTGDVVRMNFTGPAAVTVNTVVSGTSPSIEAAYPEYSQLLHGMVWHYRDAKGKSFNCAAPVDEPAPYVVPQINEGLDGEDIYVTQMTTANAHLLARPSSAHTDGVNMAFADGSTRFVTQEIDYRFYQAMMTPRGKSSDVPFREYIAKGDAF